MIKLVYMIECQDRMVAAEVQDTISLNKILGIHGVEAVNAQWIAERENLEDMGG